MINIFYQVRFRYYQHNDGYNANGYYTYESKNFEKLEKAQIIYDELVKQPTGLKRSSTNWLGKHYDLDGWLEGNIQLIKITEEDISREEED